MGHLSSRSWCQCAKSTFSLTSTFLVLSGILPSSSFAQVTNAPPPPQRPSTLSTSVSSSSPTASAPPVSTESDPSVSTTEISSSASHAFNFYFLILGVGALLLCIGTLYIGRRKRRKAAMMRSDGRNALARDVEGWRTRLGYGRAVGSSNTIHGMGRDDGLDERGEAPPPYAPAPKPLIVKADDGGRPSTVPGVTVVEVLELGTLTMESHGLPMYRERMDQGREEDIADVRRPATDVTAPDMFETTTLAARLRRVDV